jgi:Fic family protein
MALPASTPSGRYVRQPSGYESFVPNSLPPEALDLDRGLAVLLSDANHALGRLDGIAGAVPDRDIFLFTYIRREAVLSSQIEGTQASLMDVLEYEASLHAPGEPGNIREVLNYINAVDHGLRRLETLPVSRTLLCEVHGVLMKGVRGGEPGKTPGEFRRSQNWIGGSSPANALFVPPPHTEVDQAFSDLERFLHDDSGQLIRIALGHAQFETIHPFLDGNGRLGRLLIAFWLSEKGLLRDPLLYLSLYFKQHRQVYYELLQETRTTGGWRRWLAFFLEGVAQIAREASDTAAKIHVLREDLRKELQASGRRSTHALRLLDQLFRQPAVTVSSVKEILGVSQPTALSLTNHFVELGILKEMTGRQRNRVFFFDKYLMLFPEAENAI